MIETTAICPSCESGDHEHSYICEANYLCGCPCHEGRSLQRQRAYAAAHQIVHDLKATEHPFHPHSNYATVGKRHSLQIDLVAQIILQNLQNQG